MSLPDMAGSRGEPEVSKTDRLKDLIETFLSKESKNARLKKEINNYSSSNHIPFRLIKEVVNEIADSGDKKVYLHELLDGSSLHLPEYKPPPRNPELEARIQKLKAEQDNRKYESMVKNVSAKRKDHYSAGADMKELNRQIISVVNFVITVGGAFAFGYKGTEYAFSGPNVFAFQMMAGLVLGTIVFFADLYFLVKYS